MAAPVIKANGRVLEEKWLDRLTHLRTDRLYGVVGRAVLRFEDSKFELAASSTLAVGTDVLISDVEGATLFAGTVTGIGIEQAAESTPELTVTVDDAAHRLTRTTRSTSYAAMDHVEILRKLAQTNGMSFSNTGHVPSGQAAYLLQSGSEMDFLDELTRRMNAVWWFAPGSPKTLRIAPVGYASGTTLDLTLLDDLLRFSVRASGLGPDKVEVTGWDRDTTKSVVASNTTSRAPSDLHTSVEGKLAKTTTVVAGEYPPTQREAQVVADSLYAESRAAAVTVKGTVVGNAKIDLGTKVTIPDAGPAKGTYLVTAVEHVHDRRGFHTSFTAGPHRPTALVDSLGPPADPGFTLHGFVVGIVTNNIDDADLGRVKVKYVGVSDGLESGWARVVTLGGGSKRGMLFLPEIDDEVLVGFERGDTRYPVVLGGLYSARNTLPGSAKPVAQTGVEHRRITSRVGHVIELSDAKGAEHILIQLSKTSHKIRLGADRLDLEVADAPIKIGNGQASIELTATGDVVIKGLNVKIEATTSVEVKAKAQFSAKANGPVAVEGAVVQVKGQSAAELSAGGAVTVKGATVMVN